MAFVILNKIYGENNSKTLLEIKSTVAEAFHGHGKSAKQYELFLNGADDYEHLFLADATPNGVPPKGNGVGNYFLEIPTYLSRTEDFKTRVGTTLTEHVLTLSTLKGKNKITGLTLYGAANEALKNCKKALAIANEYLIDGEPPSGHTLEDYLNHVLKEFYRRYKSPPKRLEDQDDDIESNAQESNLSEGENVPAMPEEWFFKGFWAFYLYGPYPHRLPCTLLNLNDISEINKADAGREAARKKAKTGARLPDPNSQSPFKKGITLQERMFAANIAQTSDKHKQRIWSDRNAALQAKFASLVQYHASLSTLAAHSGDYSQVDTISSEIQKVLAEMNDASNKVDRSENPMVKQLLNSIYSSKGITAGVQENDQTIATSAHLSFSQGVDTDLPFTTPAPGAAKKRAAKKSSNDRVRTVVYVNRDADDSDSDTASASASVSSTNNDESNIMRTASI